MSGIAKLILVAAVIWIVGCGVYQRDQLSYLLYPQGEPGWFCEATDADPRPPGFGKPENAILSDADLEACLELDPAGFLHDNYFYFVRNERSDAISVLSRYVAPAIGLMVIVLVLSWIGAGFRQR